MKKLKFLLSFFFAFIFLGSCKITENLHQVDNKNLELAKQYSENRSGQALLVWSDGELLLEDYQNDTSPRKRHSITEISTLFSGLTVLTAREDSLLQLDEPLSKTITEWQNHSSKSQITISQLLHLTSGIKGGNHKSIPTSEEILNKPLINPPGEKFIYGPIPFHVFGILMHRKTKFHYLSDKILNPIGIEGGYWTIEQEAFEHSIDRFTMPRLFDGSNLTASELGRIGKLLLNDGKWDGKTIIDDLDPLTKPTKASPGYGLGVWLNKNVSSKSDSTFLNNLPENIFLMRNNNQKKLIYDGAPSDLFMAAGRHNQRLYVIPSKEMVIVRLGGADLRWSDAKFLARLLNGTAL